MSMSYHISQQVVQEFFLKGPVFLENGKNWIRMFLPCYKNILIIYRFQLYVSVDESLSMQHTE